MCHPIYRNKNNNKLGELYDINNHLNRRNQVKTTEHLNNHLNRRIRAKPMEQSTTMFIYVLFYFIKSSEVYNFADDSTPSVCDFSLDEIIRKLEDDIQRTLSWLNTMV